MAVVKTFENQTIYPGQVIGNTTYIYSDIVDKFVPLPNKDVFGLFFPEILFNEIRNYKESRGEAFDWSRAQDWLMKHSGRTAADLPKRKDLFFIARSPQSYDSNALIGVEGLKRRYNLNEDPVLSGGDPAVYKGGDVETEISYEGGSPELAADLTDRVKEKTGLNIKKYLPYILVGLGGWYLFSEK